MFKLRLCVLLALLDVIHHVSSPNSGERCYHAALVFRELGCGCGECNYTKLATFFRYIEFCAFVWMIFHFPIVSPKFLCIGLPLVFCYPFLL